MNQPRSAWKLLGGCCIIGLVLLAAYFAKPPAGPEPPPPAGETPATAEVAEGTRLQPPASNTPARVPGGGLEVHERLGGHTLARHVGKSAADLRARLEREPNISAASSFIDRDTAEAALAAALAARDTEIRRWLRQGDDRYELANFTWTKPVGLSLRRGAHEAREVRSLRAILQRRPTAPLGYFILTAYPQT